MENKNHSVFFYLIPVFLLIGFYSFQSYSFPIHDFANYYYGSYAILNDFFTADIYDALSFNKRLLDLGFEGLFVNYYPNTPFLAFSFIPFTALNWEDAKMIFNLLGSVFFLISLIRLARFYSIDKIFLLLLPILFFIPIKNNVLFGQTYFVVFGLLSEGLLQYERDRKKWAASIWAIAILLKVFPVVLFLWLLLRKDYRCFIYLSSACVILVLATIPFIGYDVWWYFGTHVFPKSSSGIIYDGFTVKAKSATILFKNLFVYDKMLNPDPLIKSETLFILVSTLYKSIIFAFCIYASLDRKKSLLLPFGLWIFISLLLGPNSSSYAKILLLFPVVFICTQFEYSWKLGGFLVAVLLANNLPGHLFYDYDVILAFPVLYLQILLFLFVVISMGLKLDFRYLVGSFISFILLAILPQGSPATYDYVLAEDGHPLILSKLGSKNGNLLYFNWGIDGESAIETSYQIESMTKEGIEILDNDLYHHGKRLTKSGDRKREAYIVNQKEVFFLSDLNRGDGCYALRKIPL